MTYIELARLKRKLTVARTRNTSLASSPKAPSRSSMGPGTGSDSCRSPSACSAERPLSAPAVPASPSCHRGSIAFGMMAGIAGVSIPTSSSCEPTATNAAGGGETSKEEVKKAPVWARGLFGVGGPVEESDLESELSDDRPKLWERTWYLAVRYLWDSWSAPAWYTRFVQTVAGFIVLDPFTDLFIIICILLNTACLAAEDANSDKEQIDFLKAANKVILCK